MHLGKLRRDRLIALDARLHSRRLGANDKQVHEPTKGLSNKIRWRASGSVSSVVIARP